MRNVRPSNHSVTQADADVDRAEHAHRPVSDEGLGSIASQQDHAASLSCSDQLTGPAGNLQRQPASDPRRGFRRRDHLDPRLRHCRDLGTADRMQTGADDHDRPRQQWVGQDDRRRSRSVEPCDRLAPPTPAPTSRTSAGRDAIATSSSISSSVAASTIATPRSEVASHATSRPRSGDLGSSRATRSAGCCAPAGEDRCASSLSATGTPLT